MKTIKIKVYEFKELSNEAQAHAIEQYRTRKYEDDSVLYFFKESCEEQIKEAGFSEPELQYSLSYSQGDGLSFSAKAYTKIKDLFMLELGAGKERTAQLLTDNTTQILKGNEGRYCYAHKNQIDLYLENWTSSINCRNTDRIDAVITKVCERLENLYIDLCSKLKEQGYEELEYAYSDECIKEDIEANELEFTEDGKRY